MVNWKHSPLVFLSIICLSQWIRADQCPGGWFGSKCTLLCHCQNKVCDYLGQCSEDIPCMRGWFGPSCQYVDLAVGASELPWLSDGLDSTCNSNKQKLTTVDLKLDIQFTWLWIVVENEDRYSDIDITFNGNSLCNMKESTNISRTILEVFCSVMGTSKVKKISLEGKGVAALCSVHVSGGRNLALRQDTEYFPQVSTASNSKLAVDGDNSASSCARTEYAALPQWNLILPRAQAINRFVIYPEMETGKQEPLYLSAADLHGKEVFKTNISHGKQYGHYSKNPIWYSGDTLIDLVTVYSQSKTDKFRICELEAYGDIVCGKGRYGFDCEKTCTCRTGEPCHPDMGICGVSRDVSTGRRVSGRSINTGSKISPQWSSIVWLWVLLLLWNLNLLSQASIISSASIGDFRVVPDII